MTTTNLAADGQAMPAAPTRRNWLSRLATLAGGTLLGLPALARATRRGPTQVQGQGAMIGEILLCAFPFAPKNFAMCNGQLLSVQQNQALFSLIGTTYGGDGRTTFGLPDLRGRVPRGQGNNYPMGTRSGSENVSLFTNSLPNHNHADNVSSAAGTSSSPVNGVPALVASTNLNGEAVSVLAYGSGMAASGPATGSAGSSASVPIVPPFLALNYCICLFGYFPVRN